MEIYREEIPIEYSGSSFKEDVANYVFSAGPFCENSVTHQDFRIKVPYPVLRKYLSKDPYYVNFKVEVVVSCDD